MQITVTAETLKNERRVALIPESVKKLIPGLAQHDVHFSTFPQSP